MTSHHSAHRITLPLENLWWSFIRSDCDLTSHLIKITWIFSFLLWVDDDENEQQPIFHFTQQNEKNSWNCGCFRFTSSRLSFQMIRKKGLSWACKKALEKGITLHHFFSLSCLHALSALFIIIPFLHTHIFVHTALLLLKTIWKLFHFPLLFVLLTIKVMTST